MRVAIRPSPGDEAIAPTSESRSPPGTSGRSLQLSLCQSSTPVTSNRLPADYLSSAAGDPSSYAGRPLGESVFTLALNVRYMEVDPQRVVLNAWYLTDFDEVMTAVLKARGLL